MKNKLILTAAIIILLTSGRVLAADFFPETEFDPFKSELNPEYIDKSKTAEGEFELKKFIREKLQDRKSKKEAEKAAKKEKKQRPEKRRAADETFISKPKKHLTNEQLERELNKEEREKEKVIQKEAEKNDNRTLLEKVFNTKKSSGAGKGNGKEIYTPPENPNINFTADIMEYFPDKSGIEASGNAKAEFQEQNIKLYADKLTFDHDRNILTASGNVLLSSPDSDTEGDFLRLDLNKPSGWFENPVTKAEDIQLSAKEAYIYSDKIEEFDGKGKILKDDVITLGGRSFASYVDQSGLFDDADAKLSKNSKGIYKIKAKTVIIDAKQDHDIITIKNAGVYLKNHKIAVIPSMKIVSNKSHAVVETNIPEFGSSSRLGLHAGPAVVLNIPGGSTLKLAPVLTYGDSKFGFGAIARFMSGRNVTEAAYGTSKKKFILKGRQELSPGLSLNYARYSNLSEWFLGYRMPKYAAELTYSRTDNVKDLKLNFSQLYSAGLYVDDKDGHNLHNTHTRFRWMTQIYKPIYEYKNKEANGGLRLGLTAQTAVSLYSHGDVVGIFRIGPSLSTQYGRWKQTLAYYQTASAGKSPFDFDRYRYGKSNVVLIESFNVCKYLTLGYLASISMHNQYYHDDYYNDGLLQESRFMASIGPEYTKLILGYDAVRHTFMMQAAMLIGTKDSDIEFKKSIIKNPDKLGQDNKNDKQAEKAAKEKRKLYKKYKKEAEKEAEQRV